MNDTRLRVFAVALSSASTDRFDPCDVIGTSVDNGGDTADEDEEADEAGCCWGTVDDDDGGDCDNDDEEDDDAVAAGCAACWLLSHACVIDLYLRLHWVVWRKPDPFSQAEQNGVF